MTDRLNHKQTAALLTLMVLARTVPNPELAEVVGFRLDGKDRVVLNAMDLVESHMEGRRYVHTLTTAGWAWCADELKALTPPPPHGSLSAAFYVLLSGLGNYIQRENLSLAALFTSDIELTPEEIEPRVTVAYRELARSPRAWVGLTDLRTKLGNARRDQVDGVLMEMYNAERLELAPKSDRKALARADHDAALRFGGLEYNQLRIVAS